MKKYIGCKIIQAEPMNEFAFLNKVKNQDPPQQRENRPGYLVQYPDGYTSWSPKEVFEVAYREITPAEIWIINVDKTAPQGPSVESKTDH
jgi:hypothetical protein